MQPALISVMMPAYNAADYIAQAIESVLGQSYHNWELIIVDDGSTDHTSDIVARYADPRIHLTYQPNGGESVARNQALTLMHGEFVAFLDADDLFLPHHLSATVAYLLSHPEVEGVYTDGYYCTEQGSSLAPLSSQRRGPFNGWIFEELVLASDVFGPPICVVLRHESVVQRHLRFNPNIVIGPDWDFFTRCAEHAHFGYLNQATCMYRVHETNITKRTDQRKRASSLAKCRETAIKLQKFSSCAPETRVAVFYDLLVNLLKGSYQRQDEISHWPEFVALPKNEQSRLLRLMASKNMGHQSHRSGDEQYFIENWLVRAHTLNPRCTRARLLHAMYKISPDLCSRAIHVKHTLNPGRSQSSPFGSLV